MKVESGWVQHTDYKMLCRQIILQDDSDDDDKSDLIHSY